ncbi:nitroreductase family protein [Fulvivirga sp. 29W222]|uniref:Nitroreductase family protein n=1 Tax=Fulvivirga marina TaxID=2494733 RepID=A0A937FX82_9BACT|nr:nitroreductase family protein [Fulvivirga marina]MBL6447759.1 nitroreductase family protein [Fulvivirga marina]
MNFKDLAKNRYTTKKYDATKKIPEAEVNQLKEILNLSPSSINSQPWKFTFVSSQEVKNQLADVSYFNDAKVKEASHVVVFSVLDSVKLFEEQIHKNLPEGPISYYNQFLKPKSDDEIKAWMSHQVYLALGFFLSACASMGIDSTPMEGIKSEGYASILGLENYKPLFSVSIGYRDTEDANQPSKKPKSRLALEEVVVEL